VAPPATVPVTAALIKYLENTVRNKRTKYKPRLTYITHEMYKL